MKYPSRQGRQENGNHIRKERRELDLSRHKGFTYVSDIFSVSDSRKNRAAHYLYTSCLEYEIELRYSQSSQQWTAICPHFEIEIQFPHDKPSIISTRLNTWLLDYIESVLYEMTAVFDIAKDRNCTLEDAKVIFDDRASL